MMKIEVIVGPSRLDDVMAALDHAWISGVTVTEVKGLGGGPRPRYRGAELPPALEPVLRVEIVTPTPLLPRLLHDLAQRLRTGRGDDGLVLVVPVDEAIRVRTGERGEGAL